MIEHHIKTPPGRFSLCHCGSEPRLIIIKGRSLRETGTPTPTTRHMLECPCGRHTAKHASVLSAETEWGPLLSQRPLALPAPVTLLHSRRSRKEVRHG
jgi:hypothetical protein